MYFYVQIYILVFKKVYCLLSYINFVMDNMHKIFAFSLWEVPTNDALYVGLLMLEPATEIKQITPSHPQPPWSL